MLLRNGEDYLSSFWIIINTTILKCQMKLGVAAQNCNPNLGRVKQEDYKSELNLSFKGSLHVRKKKKQEKIKWKTTTTTTKRTKTPLWQSRGMRSVMFWFTHFWMLSFSLLSNVGNWFSNIPLILMCISPRKEDRVKRCFLPVTESSFWILLLENKKQLFLLEKDNDSKHSIENSLCELVLFYLILNIMFWGFGDG